ncbi:SDR family NAD(P)-dependent oxidoreductase [Antribacter gilvus]|uniref:SDR family NAD(P)-dependent oxidoreductase n=1 Tax=Antribacter gilvus TaxID=2304675 RepID=UPI001F0C25E8|nr:glucose 1-dehydrogenase [Antribacter gilvus]
MSGPEGSSGLAGRGGPDGLAGRVAIVTGGARGIGEACVRALHGAGAHVVVADLLDDVGKALAADLGERAVFEHLDVTDEDDWSRVVGATTERLGGVDVLVNNAGIGDVGRVTSITRERWDAVIAVNLTGVFLGCRAVTPAMIAAGRGSIVNISSVEGLRGSAALHAYVASKFGVRGLTKSLAMELGPRGVRVNSVHPGFVMTDMTASMDPEYAHIPLGRPAQPDDVARPVLFLAGDGSAYLSGTEVVVDGGMTAGIQHA